MKVGGSLRSDQRWEGQLRVLVVMPNLLCMHCPFRVISRSTAIAATCACLQHFWTRSAKLNCTCVSSLAGTSSQASSTIQQQ
jgi:hypothetical protein